MIAYIMATRPERGAPPALPTLPAVAPSRSGEEACGPLGVGLGLLATAALFATSDPQTEPLIQILRALAFGGIITLPGALAVLARRRPTLYLAAGVAGFPLSVLTLSIYGLIFVVPAGMAIGAYAQRSGEQRPRMAAPVIAMLCLVLGILAFASLLVHEDPRCDTIENGISCSSDVVTVPEALASIAVTTLAVASAWLLSAPKKR